jgi:outer membrane protein assembly factor BamD
MMQVFAKRTRCLLPLLLALFLLSGCSSTSNWIKSWFGFETGGTEMGENELIWEAMDQYQEGEYSQALEYFERFKDHYPFSKYAILADLKVADCNYYLGKYEDAFFDYEEFENLHPLNEAVPYVVYQSGLCKYKQIDSVDRDQKNAAKAVEIFRRLQTQYPESVYAQKATEKVDHATKNTGWA